MNSLLERVRIRFFPPVGKREAINIAQTTAPHRPTPNSIHRKKPENINVYNLPTEPSWFIFMPWGDGKDETMLRSSRLMLVSKISGDVLYDGSAHDEG